MPLSQQENGNFGPPDFPIFSLTRHKQNNNFVTP